jgi:tetratricopeptide (TPR) repeat protein
MESLIHFVHQAVAAFKQKNYEDSILFLDKAYEYASAMEYTAMDSQIFNSLYDAYEMLALIAELGVFEKNAFLQLALDNYREALNAFTSDKGGTLAALQKASKDFEQLLSAMTVAVHYLKRKKWRITDFPPMVSFEFTSDGQIRFYAWRDGQQNKVGQLEDLKKEFNALFLKEQKSEEYYWQEADRLMQEEQYDELIKLLKEVMQVHESLKAEAFLRLAMVYLQKGMAEQALDMLMKAKVLGQPMLKIKEKGRLACQKLIRTAENNEERVKWTKLLEDFF